METVVNYNAEDDQATLYTSDKPTMRKLDKLVKQFPKVYRLVKEDGLSKTYSFPKLCVTYRKPRKLTDEQREQKRVLMMAINGDNN